LEDIKSFNEKINPFFCRTTKKDLSVPKANDDVVKNILMSNEEEFLFERIYKELKYQNPLEFIIRCMQASSNPKLLSKKIPEDIFNSFRDGEEGLGKELKEADLSDKTVLVNLEYSSKFLECVNFVKELSKQGKTVIL
jgi:hypothetical protein